MHRQPIFLPRPLSRSALSRIQDRKNRSLHRQLTALPPSPPGQCTRPHAPPAVNLTSNDYLGLSHHPDILSAATQAANTWGVGATASRLISGTKRIHSDLENALASFKAMPSALAFPTGFQTNLGALQALATLGVTFYSDEYNHASIVDACKLAKAPTKIFRHRDMDHLRQLLLHHRSQEGTPVIVTDTVFSTTGAKADLPALDALSREFDALLAVDEAHATGVIGPKGAGLCADTAVRAPLQTATLSKAFGAAGGFVATTPPLADLLINEARAFIYTTGLSPVLAAAALQALSIIESPEGARLRAILHQNAIRLASALRHQGWKVSQETHIVAVILGDPLPAIRAAQALARKGVFALPFRPPTVPQGLSLLRLAPSAAHDETDINHVINAFSAIRDRFLPSRPGR